MLAAVVMSYPFLCSSMMETEFFPKSKVTFGNIKLQSKLSPIICSDYDFSQFLIKRQVNYYLVKNYILRKF